MKDKFGTFRGKCLEGCACIEFKAGPDGGSVRCSGCNHAPIKHESYGIVGKCRGCTECRMFEASYGEFEFCEYCECALRQHCVQPKPAAVVQVSGGDVNKDMVSISPIYTQQQQMTPQIGADPQYQFGVTQTQPMQPFTHPNSNIDASIGQMGQPPMNQMGQIPINQMGQIPMNQTGQAPMNQMGQAPMNQMGQAPMYQMGQPPINQMGQAPMYQMGQAPMNQMGQPPMNQMGQIPMNQTGVAQFNPMVPNACMTQDPMASMGTNPFSQHQNVPQLQQTMQPPNPMKCAIQECDQVPFCDPMMGQQACCSLTHAMEHERRKALGSNLVKGITHCLLPTCNKNVWPFMNYCGKTHAEAGKQLGLIPPDPNAGTPSQREVSEGVCAFPGCKKTRFLEEGKEHPYCSRAHSQQGTADGISPEDVTKPEDRCAIPGCWKPKFIEAGVTHPFCSRSHRKKAEDMGSKLVVDPDAQCEFPSCNLPNLIESDGTQQDYCSKRHSEMDTPRRDAALLTDRKEVDKWLKTFPNLTVTDIKENPHALPGGALFKLYKEKYKSLAVNNRKTALAFHGTADANIDNICKNGYNPGLRSGQAHGPGEYFATTPDISFSYCRGGKRMFVNELLLGTPNQHHTQSGGIIVMKDPAHDLPRFVITFQ